MPTRSRWTDAVRALEQLDFRDLRTLRTIADAHPNGLARHQFLKSHVPQSFNMYEHIRGSFASSHKTVPFVDIEPLGSNLEEFSLRLDRWVVLLVTDPSPIRTRDLSCRVVHRYHANRLQTLRPTNDITLDGRSLFDPLVPSLKQRRMVKKYVTRILFRAYKPIPLHRIKPLYAAANANCFLLDV